MSKVYQVKVAIKDIKPEIWRRIIVSSSITFYKFHKIIQAAFGWQDYHLFNFDFKDTIVEIPDLEFSPGESYGENLKALNAKRIKIDELLTERKNCTYTYDFGDNWEHEVILEKEFEAEKGVKYPLCIQGARNRPPEDVGGTGGYESFIRIIGDENNPEQEENLIWAEKDTNGRKFDPEYFYLREVNKALLKIK
ncbi:plasmid pRiA4b ORF-3 family protein [Clostridium sp.]